MNIRTLNFKYFKLAIKKIVLVSFFLAFIFCFVSCMNPLHKNKFIISGTYLEVISPHKEAAKIVYDEFRRLDKIFNLYSELSELTQLNQTLNTPFKASLELIEVLQLARQVYDLSEGAFDVSHGTLYRFWKDIIKKGKIEEFPSQDKLDDVKALGGMQHLEINESLGTVTIKKKGLLIDLGAIAKGYMVDKAVLKLNKKGVKDVLINAGGDMYCLGKNKNEPWKVGIKNPKEMQGVIETQYLVNEAIATSGDYEQFFEYKGQRYSHLIDPRTGLPVKGDILSVSVITKNCTTADSLASAFFIMGKGGINKFLSKNPSTMRIFVLSSNTDGAQIHIFK